MLEHFYESIPGWFNFRDIYERVVRELPDGARVVEIGSWYGRSAAFLAVEIARSGKRIDFHCVDTWRGSVDSPWMAEHLNGATALPIFQDNMRRGGVADRIHVVSRSSVEAARDFADESLDFVMIDASHDFRSVRADVRAWYPKVKRGGLLAGDDADWPGVLIAVRETIPDSEIAVVNGGANWLHKKQRAQRGTWTFRRASSPSDLLAYIPYVNRPDLLARAIRSVEALWPALVVIDQSSDGLRDDFWLDLTGARERMAGVFRAPTGAMHFTQMMNWAQQEAQASGASTLIFMHNDAEVTDPRVIDTVLACSRAPGRTGVVFTNFDAFCAFNVAAVSDVGPWDETFRWYFSDNDYYRRLRLQGWRTEDVGAEGVGHHVSQTLQSDEAVKRSVDEGWRWHSDHYAHKWGGPPGAETYTIPYDGRAW